MASELGNQLLARVQAEMARNIATIKRQLIEWLERPESGGVDALRESMAEISGGLSLMEQEEAVALAEAIVAGVESLDQGVNEHGVNASFADKGAEIASGLLVLAGYIERLDHISDTQKQSVMQATAAVKTLLAGGEKIQVTTQPFIIRRWQTKSTRLLKSRVTRLSSIFAIRRHLSMQKGLPGRMKI